MHKLIIISAVLASAAALPAYLVDDFSKSSLTKSSQLVDHGSTYIHTPVLPVVHEISSKKSTLTKSSQVVNHGGTAVLHAPVVHVPVHSEYHVPVHSVYHSVHPVHSTVYHSVHPVHSSVYHEVPVHSSVLLHSSPYVGAVKGDSAVSHHSSTVHETVPVVNHLPLYALHH